MKPTIQSTAHELIKAAAQNADGGAITMDEMLARWPHNIPAPSRNALISALHQLVRRQAATGVHRVSRGVYEYRVTLPIQLKAVRKAHQATKRNQRTLVTRQAELKRTSALAKAEPNLAITFDVAASAARNAASEDPIVAGAAQRGSVAHAFTGREIFPNYELIMSLADGRILLRDLNGRIWVAKEI